ncbi:hypothetical protein Zmor_004309 [Zophobas morio]|uniref:Class II aldolase/adducin N-terminal domain-containing protein n=1 Tax=Zophobas morio TaxID=2755281 RepID=A0AA38M0C8_9CUCU|nr:hypothetical protein Zmor_004309 [Zophobas morio]
MDIEAYGTTHADSFEDKIHCTRNLTMEEIDEGYEMNTGKVIVETFEKYHNDILLNPAVLAKSHGLFTFGKSGMDAVNNAVITEQVSEMAFYTQMVSKEPIAKELFKKHNERKHGDNAYYGQKGDH